MNIFTIQNEGMKDSEFKELLLKGLTIPERDLLNYDIGSYIRLSKHYFMNFYKNFNLFEIYGSFEEFIKTNENISSKEFETKDAQLFEKYKITIFVDKVLN